LSRRLIPREFPSYLGAEHNGFLTGLKNCPSVVTLEAMEVNFTPGEEAQLSQIATTAGTDAEQLVRKAALRLLEDDARFRAAVREGVGTDRSG